MDIVLHMLEPMVVMLRKFECNGWVPPTDKKPGYEVLLSHVLPQFMKMRGRVLDATPDAWKPSTLAAILATQSKAITDAHVCV